MSGIKSTIVTIMTLCAFFLGAPVFADDRFTDNGDGTVSDHQLGVMWAKTDNQGNINWKQANLWIKYTFPDTLEKKYDNWRLPTLAELESLYIKEKKIKGYETDCGQRVKIVPVIKLSCGWVWTSETSAIQAFIFNFNRGYHYSDRMVHNKSYRALPVRDLK
ncbi:MAG: DUF1566 domain-containing protein [Desulfobacteraceae bacterium]|nr:DUF1566 domain-containing protein [Desulfobacteraceae bacterium]MDH3722270.1 DUF1566 domain-containing protein [Desulfobacteraceae bacterium]MDH3838815.1 DUF1566 domain-containing protein [Desulfobacteraceae bacterium]MDH3875396.1 DUF1566 domain-containing protein [Desulfobacteraceae bacterium]MDH3881504.1 DUF1566 domain-containing protein [Desulfobacteraceae bacterium]